MITKRQIQLVRSLERKRERDLQGLFVAEGPKLVGELLHKFGPHSIFATSDGLTSLRGQVPAGQVTCVSPAELERLSLLSSPHEVVAVFHKPQELVPPQPRDDEFIIALDGVQDPGNVGTILRLADWFGIDRVVCSPMCADVYSPKVVQATMGALAHVEVLRCELPAFLQRVPAHFPVWGTMLEGENIYHASLERRGIMLLGSEGNGISPECERFLTRRLFIPPRNLHRPTCESLNVSTAAAIAISEFCKH